MWIICANRLLRNSAEDKLTRERPQHKSNALFNQKASENQLDNVSKVLALCIFDRVVVQIRELLTRAGQVKQKSRITVQDNDESNNCTDFCSSVLDGLDNLFYVANEVFAKIPSTKIE